MRPALPRDAGNQTSIDTRHTLDGLMVSTPLWKLESLPDVTFRRTVKFSAPQVTTPQFSLFRNIQVLSTSGCDMTQLFFLFLLLSLHGINSYHRQPDLYIQLLTVTRQGNSGRCDDCTRCAVYWIVANARCREDGMKMRDRKKIRFNRSVCDIRQWAVFQLVDWST